MKIENLKLKFLLCFLILRGANTSTVVISDYGMAKMIELSTKPPYCLVQIDRGKIRDKLLSLDPRRVRKMSDEAVENLAKACNKEISTAHQGGFIYPGTKWCGPGNIAQSYDDLGYHHKEDICCRDHDNCPKSLIKGECKQGICNNSPFTRIKFVAGNIAQSYDDLGYHHKEDICCRDHDNCPKSLIKGECKQGICNNSPFTRSHCDCDANFRKCLQNVNTETANTIGAIFFNIIQVICFTERTPCTQWQRNGYTKEEGDTLCSQIHFRPSEKYVPLMPLP